MYPHSSKTLTKTDVVPDSLTMCQWITQNPRMYMQHKLSSVDCYFLVKVNKVGWSREGSIDLGIVRGEEMRKI